MPPLRISLPHTQPTHTLVDNLDFCSCTLNGEMGSPLTGLLGSDVVSCGTGVWLAKVLRGRATKIHAEWFTLPQPNLQNQYTYLPS